MEKSIITHEQYEEIIKLYPESPRRISQILPILASILIGLSLLTFVASNWDGIPQITRLAILTVTMISFYTSGYTLYKKGHQWLGQGLLSLGVVSFGASMILVGQMFHLVAYDARVFVLWALAGLGLLYLYRKPVFFLLASVLIFSGQIYSFSSFSTISWTLLLLTGIGLGKFAYQDVNPLSGWVLSILLHIQAVLLIISRDIAWSWVAFVPLGLYAIGMFLRRKPIAQGFLVLPTIFSFFFSMLMVFIHEHVYDSAEFITSPFAYFIGFIAVLLVVLWQGHGNKGKWLPLILFLPFFFLTHGDVAYLISMFVFSAILIFYGDHQYDAVTARIGVFLFMLSSFIGYIQLAWDFLDKSFFFLIGGLLLFSIHWILKKRRLWMTKGEDKDK
ncbi:DUF2157 domain-containing protein [Ammoniphilus sp. CFH 90114]|uniref:DUF2157 domain-containing protein n=1 Tax=Ammoniphilus sp. CFH 90114 TaxID=2493665 RepID=UPI0013E8FC32|nr:DUF2157 domain-containing protein [Ammoniphilus sp. CFH 90114]